MGVGKTQRAASDRGRYPEDATPDDEVQREDTPPSDDGETEPEATNGLNYKPGANHSEPINISKPVTPAHSTVDMDEPNPLYPDSLNGCAMDIDMVCTAFSNEVLIVADSDTRQCPSAAHRHFLHL